MVTPKLNHKFVELTFAVNLPDQRSLAQLIWNRFAVIAFEEFIADGFQFVGFHLQCLEGREQDVAIKIVDRLKIELFLDPRLDTDFLKAKAFLYARPECEPLQSEEVTFVERRPWDNGEVAHEPAIHGSTRRKRCAGRDECTKFEEFASGESHGNW